MDQDTTMISDDQLMCKFQKGDETAFRRLLERYQDRIVNFTYRIVRDRAMAQDLSQEVFIRVYTNAGRYRPGSRFAPWLYRIASNLAINEIRRKKRWRFISIDNRATSEDRNVITDLEDTDSISADTHVSRIEAAARVETALEKVPLKYRTPLILREIEGYDYEEISQILDIPRGTVKSRLNRGRALLKTALTRMNASEISTHEFMEVQ